MSEAAIVAVATRLRADEAEALKNFPVGVNTSEKARVLLRFALAHQRAAKAWFNQVDQESAT